MTRLLKLSFRIAFLKNNFRSITNSSWNQPTNGYDTGIKIYNCTKRTKVPLIVQNDKLSTWYTCGPTVYDFTHIGHASCYIKLDIIQRILKNYFNIELITAMNITDIDDKIIKKTAESKVGNFKEISEKFECDFWKDMNNLNILQPNIKIRVTENIPYITKFIERFLQNNQAYIGKDNSVYFQVNKYKNYGKLQRINIDELKLQDSNKNADIDFALWKAQKHINEPAWPVPWGNINGRPGWHIECSALATKIFGNKIDFHAGGLDLKFPHHENEEAQSCSYHNIEQWVNYWLHTGQLSLKGQDQKMSKSLKNTISVDELLEKYTADEFRMACALSNYRNSMEFSEELMILAKTNVNRFNSFLSDCQAYLDGKIEITNADSNDILKQLNLIKNSIDLALKDDFDTSKCIGCLSELTSNVNKILKRNDELRTSSLMPEIACIKNFVQNFLSTMGFVGNAQLANINKKQKEADLNDLIDKMVEIRYNIRQLAISNKNQNLFKMCDEIRHVLKCKNIEIKDHIKGSSWSST